MIGPHIIAKFYLGHSNALVQYNLGKEWELNPNRPTGWMAVIDLHFLSEFGPFSLSIFSQLIVDMLQVFSGSDC